MTTTPPTQDEAATEAQSVLAVIARAATDDSVDMDKMERLLQLQERILEKRAIQEANKSLYTFQAKCPQLKKSSTTQTFKFCSYQAMMAEVRPLMELCGFSERFDTATDAAGNINAVVCTIVHRLGHSWTSTFPVKIDQTGAKTENQGIGSALSYGKRYSFAAAMGIVFKNEDTDGQTLHHGPPKKMVAKVPAWQTSTPVNISGDSRQQVMTWIETKGFTVEEFNAALYVFTKNKYRNWQKLPPERFRDVTTQQALASIEKIITEGRGE